MKAIDIKTFVVDCFRTNWVELRLASSAQATQDDMLIVNVVQCHRTVKFKVMSAQTPRLKAARAANSLVQGVA